MPLKVRFKILAAVIAGLALVWLLGAFVSGWLALVVGILGLLYAEMINPRWNFFGPAILDVKSQSSLKSPAVAITFDDGPSPWTLSILDTLKKENVRATFFLLGINIERYPEIARQIENDGHTIGTHGYSHTKYHLKSLSFIRSDLNRADEVFKKIGLRAPKLVRFPHGVKNVFAVKEVQSRGLKLCSWGRGVWDSKNPGVTLIVERALKLNTGEILLLHDGAGAAQNVDRQQTAESLGLIIQGLRAKGFHFVSLA